MNKRIIKYLSIIPIQATQYVGYRVNENSFLTVLEMQEFTSGGFKSDEEDSMEGKKWMNVLGSRVDNW